MKSTTGHRIGIAAALATLLAAACGGDDEGDSKPAPPPGQPATASQPGAAGGGKAPAGGAAKRGGKKEVALKMYARVEEQGADAKESAALRRRFRPEDFLADVTGNDNRDPFRSYVIRQVAVNTPDRTAVQTTAVCTEKNMRAPNPLAQDYRARKSYSLRDLRLAGIVLRGARSYAQFSDPTGYGHIVVRDDCVGKEKARVTQIGAGYVTLEVTPEQGTGATGAEPQQRKIELHPEELQLEEEVVEETPTMTNDGTPAGPTPSPADSMKEGGTADQPKQP